MLTDIFQTGIVLLFSSIIMRKCSSDDAEKWWKIAVASIGCIGFVSMVAGSLLMIWTQ